MGQWGSEDLAARQRVEEALVAERGELALTLSSIGDGLIATDVDGRIVLFNPMAERLTGWSRAEALGKPLLDVFRIVNVKTRQPASDPVRQALECGVNVGLEEDTALIAKDGTEYYVSSSIAPMRDAQGGARGIVLVFRDISQLKRAEEELRESKEYARSLIESSLDMIIAVDMAGRIIEFNRAAEETFGYAASQVLGKHVRMLYANPEQNVAVQEEMRTHGRFVGEVLNKRKDGKVFPSLLSASLLKDSAGNIVGLMGVSRDITKLKQAEEQTIRAERLAALGRMAAALAHEINNPLQAIRSMVDLVLDFPLEPAEREENLRIVRQEIERLSEVTGRILQFARPPSATRCPVLLPDLIQRTIVLARKQMQHAHITITTDFQPTPPLLVAPEQLIQVFVNLILNAIEAAGDGGRLNIIVRCENNTAIVSFANDGPSISPEEMPQIFEPFFTTKQKGSGLGLSVSQTIVQQHGGAITVENLGTERGVVFTVRLPVG